MVEVDSHELLNLDMDLFFFSKRNAKWIVEKHVFYSSIASLSLSWLDSFFFVFNKIYQIIFFLNIPINHQYLFNCKKYL